MAIITLRRDVAYPTAIFVSGNGERGATYRQSLEGKTVSVVGLAKSGVAAARLIRRSRFAESGLAERSGRLLGLDYAVIIARGSLRSR